jgi:hypothetical protein
MGGNVGASQSQLDNIAKMEAREKPMTPAMQEKYNKDIKARNNPQLPAGAKTYCKQWLKEQPGFYGRRKQLKSKYLDKGNECEDTAINFLNAIHLEDYQKNEEYFENEYITGTPDILKLIAKLSRDTKCSWDSSTFPLFEDSCDNDYFWQGQCYMNLTGTRRHSVDYCLINTPMHLIEREIKIASYSSTKGNDELREYYYDKLTFDHVPMKLRVKSFEFKYDDSKIQQLIERVKLCRVYIRELMEDVE